MKKIKCFSIVSAVVEEATLQFRPMYKLNEEWYDMLKQYCDVIDALSEESDNVAFEVHVDRITHHLSISMECPVFSVGVLDELFIELAKRTLELKFENCDGENIRVTFVFPSLWV